jgi:hypothetical protein
VLDRDRRDLGVITELRAIVDAAAVVARDPKLRSALVSSTRPSPEGVAHALRECLELDVTDAELAQVAQHAVATSRVHVILSANVFVAPLRALVLARAAAPTVTVRPSRREPVFARALVEQLGSDAIRIADEKVEDITEGEIHVYGRDETIADVVRRARAPVIGHGAGMGIAFLPRDAELRAAARALARDVAAFDQRGCLSPRIAFVEGDSAAFATILADELEEIEKIVPRGELDDDERREAVRWADTVAFAGELHRRATAIVGHADALAVPPPGRHVHVTAWRSAALESIAPFVVTVGAPSIAAATAMAPAHARPAALGQMQRPRLDGPVDRRKK